MVIGFIIWALTAAVVAGVGVWMRRAPEPVGFFAGVKPPKVKDAAAYNRAVARLLFVYAALLVLLGVPLLFPGASRAWLLVPILGTVLLTILWMAVYLRVERKHRAEAGEKPGD